MKLKKLLNENLWNERKFGEKLPTLEDTTKAYKLKQENLKEKKDSNFDIEKYRLFPKTSLDKKIEHLTYIPSGLTKVTSLSMDNSMGDDLTGTATDVESSLMFGDINGAKKSLATTKKLVNKIKSWYVNEVKKINIEMDKAYNDFEKQALLIMKDRSKLR
jgi:hypothetical protein